MLMSALGLCSSTIAALHSSGLFLPNPLSADDPMGMGPQLASSRHAETLPHAGALPAPPQVLPGSSTSASPAPSAQGFLILQASLGPS